VDKFGKIKAITSLPQYTKMGTDGKFGPNTRDIVKILKKGFGLTDTSGDITKELVDEIQIQADTIKESNNDRIFKFSDFVNISEAAFSLTAAVDTAKALPTYKVASASSKAASKSSSAKSDGKTEVKATVEKPAGPLKQALSNTEIQDIANNLISAANGAGTAEGKVLMSIEKLKNKKDFQVLDYLIKKSNELYTSQNSSELKKLGLSAASEYKNIQDLINGEMGTDDIGTVKSIKNHLAKIGVNASYRYNTGNGDFTEDSFSIK
jgi:hypothetical protein